MKTEYGKDTGSGSKSACRSWDAGWMHGAAGSGVWSRNGRRVICCPRCGMDRFTEIQAVISVKADGLASLTWENENQEYESGDENLFSSGNQDGSLEMINMIFRMKQYLIQHLTNW